ncbi:hypothetical protein M422DRAFT_45090 [Sphaerobolus stellatus SS14]|nr:hypothetical protein M422DRAFT_45090 [Sphaerobolus stellatus SS14]
MSGYPSRDYYRTPSRPSTTREHENLPPLRSVLGEQLDMVSRARGQQRTTHSHSYDLGDMSRALPPSTTRDPYEAERYRDTRHREEYTGRTNAGSLPTRTGSAVDRAYGRVLVHDPESTSHWHRVSEQGNDRSPNRKFACNWPGCDKRFERQNALDTHMNIHTDAKPFVCPVVTCGKAFNVLSNMRRHVQTTHREYQSGSEGGDYEYPSQGSRGGYSYSTGTSTLDGPRRATR